MQMYMDFRNAMINKYREDKSRKLSYTDARRMIIGDATAILRIYTFLDGWGLINFEAKDEQVEPQEPNLGIFASEGTTLNLGSSCSISLSADLHQAQPQGKC